MKECGVFSLESTHRGNSITSSRQFYSVHIIYDFQYKKSPNLSHIRRYEMFSKRLKNEFETAVVNEPSVFEPLKVFYMSIKSIVLC